VGALLTLSACGADVAPAVEETEQAQTLDSWSREPMQAHAEDPSERAIDIWIAEHGSPHARCAEEARAASIAMMPTSDVAAHCHADEGKVAGCVYDYSADGSRIVINQAHADSHDLRTHEILHVLYQCQLDGIGGDAAHNDSVWLHLPVAW
jgi:hypothetical protein